MFLHILTRFGKYLTRRLWDMDFRCGMIAKLVKTIFTGKPLWWSLFIIRLQPFFRPTTSFKRDFNTVFIWRKNLFLSIPKKSKVIFENFKYENIPVYFICKIVTYTLFLWEPVNFVWAWLFLIFFHFWGWNILNFFLFPQMNLAMPQKNVRLNTVKTHYFISFILLLSSSAHRQPLGDVLQKIGSAPVVKPIKKYLRRS